MQQRGADELSALLVASALGTLAVAAVTILMLSLVRESERTPEVAVRRAVGAGRRLLVGSALLEGATTMLLGLLVGSIVALAVGLAARGWPGSLRPGTMIPAAAAAGGLLALVIAGTVFPVLFPKRKIAEAEPRSSAPLTPNVLQIGASLVALTMGLSLGRHATTVSSTVDADAGRAVYAVSAPDSSPAARARQYADLLEALGSGDGDPASLTSPGTLHGVGPVGTVTTDCGQCSEGGLPIRWRVKAATHRFVSADTFQMLGVRVVEGRGITRGDTWSAPRVAVVNRSLAAREFQNGQPIGRGIRVVDDGDVWATVVGVVDDPPPSAFGAGVQPRYTVYLSVLQYPPSALDLLTARAADTRVRRYAAGVGLGAIDLRARDPRELLRRERDPLAWFGSRFAVQGWVMLAIASLGTLCMMRLWVGSMLVELGVRRALGAARRTIVGHVLVRAATVGLTGVAMGAWVGQSVWAALAGLAPGLPAWDGALVIRLGILLVTSALLGALPPAFGAARATPASLLSAS